MTKIRWDFQCNSSSTAYIITNMTNESKTLLDFVLENRHLLDDFILEYSWCDDLTLGAMVDDAIRRGDILRMGENYMAFGDEDGDTLGRVYDYQLRDGGHSKSFTWRYEEALR